MTGGDAAKKRKGGRSMRIRKEVAWGRREWGGMGGGSMMNLAGAGKQWKKEGWG